MTTCYEIPPREVRELLNDVRAAYYPILNACDLKVDLLFTWKEDDGEVVRGLKAHGYPAAATMEIRSLKLRAQRLGDALLRATRARGPHSKHSVIGGPRCATSTA